MFLDSHTFRGALDVQSTAINEEMKISATYAIAQLAKEPVPEEVKKIYPKENLVFGRDYIPAQGIRQPSAAIYGCSGSCQGCDDDWSSPLSDLGLG